MKHLRFYTLCLCLALLFPTVLLAQGVSKPKITNIPGGFFAEWDSLVDVAAIQLDKRIAGPFEMMFDVPSVDDLTAMLSRKHLLTDTPKMVAVLADYWMLRGKSDRAISLYESSIKSGNLEESEMVIFHNNLAMLYSQSLGYHEKALDIVNKALETRKDNHTLLDTKGLILMNRGDYPEAIVPLQRAVELSCQLPIYCMHLAFALHKEGRTTQARRWFDQARGQLSEVAPNMGKENKAMHDELLRALPPN